MGPWLRELVLSASLRALPRLNTNEHDFIVGVC